MNRQAGEKDAKIEEISNRTQAARDEVRRRKAKARAIAKEIGAGANSSCPVETGGAG